MLVAEANITQLEANTAGITINIECPTKYPGQQITRISDTVFLKADVIVNETINNTLWAGNPNFDLELYSLSLLRTI